MMERRGLSQEGLKLIACATMLLDHIGATLYPSVGLRIIGRLALPIFCFLLAEGIHYTKNPRKYAMRLLVGIWLAEIPFDLCFFHGLTWRHQSVMVTLFLGYLYGMLQKRTENPGLKIPLILPFFILAEWFRTDYGGWGIAMVAMFVLTREMPGRNIIQAIVLAMICYMIGGMQVSLGPLRMYAQMFGLLALIPIWCYHGKKATDARWVQITFYLFYPVHIFGLFLIGKCI